MVDLLDLPSEILEMVLSVLIKAASPIISTPPCADFDNLKELHAILSLRLVHSRFRTLLDPLIFRQISCVVQHGRDAGGSRSVQKQGLFALLAFSPGVRSSVKTVNITCEHGKSTRQSPYLRERLDTILAGTHARLEGLHIGPDRQAEVPSSPPLYTGLIRWDFPNLRILSITDTAVIFSLPEIVAAAPLLHVVTLTAETLAPDDVLEQMVSTAHIPHFHRGSVTDPIEMLRLVNVGSRWCYRLLGRMKLHAKLFLLESDQPIWTASIEDQVAGLGYLADSQLFEGFVLEDYSKKYPYLYSRPQRIRIAQDICAYMITGRLQRLALMKALAHEWDGKGIALVLQSYKACGDVRQILDMPDLDLNLLDPIRLRT